MVIILTSLSNCAVVSKGRKFRNMKEAKKVLFDLYNCNNFYYEHAAPLVEEYWSRQPYYKKGI